MDRRLSREAVGRERRLRGLTDELGKLDSMSSVWTLVSRELESAFQPTCLFMWYREPERPDLALAYSSGGFIHSVQLGLDAPLVRLAELAGGPVSLPLVAWDLPRADREWLEDAGVRLIVPMTGSDQRLAGLLMLGDKKSEEPYSPDDLKVLHAIARQIAAAHEHTRLKERVEEDRRIREDAVANRSTGQVNLLKECPLCGACYDASATACATDGFALQPSLPVARTIDGKYRLDRLLGKGGVGAVYEAADLRLARPVAVKIVLRRSFGDKDALQRFERDAQASARLAHPNIVAVFDSGAAGAAGVFIAMELVRGRTLRAELERYGRLAPPTVAAWFEQICGAVGAAHQLGIVHRDLKPENVMILGARTGAGIVKVLDFGLATKLAADDRNLTHPGVVIGAAGYMAPEQLTGQELNERCDVFALGVMAAEAVTGRRPFRGRTYDELLTAIGSQPLTLGGDGAEIRRLEAVLRRAVAKDASERYASVADFARDLLPALRDVPAAVPPGDDDATVA